MSASTDKLTHHILRIICDSKKSVESIMNKKVNLLAVATFSSARYHHCHSTSDLLHRQVRPWSVSTTSRQTALARQPSASAVQACRDRPSVSPESRTDVPHRLLRSSVQRCRSPAPAICQPPSTDCSTCPLQQFWLSLLRFCWSHSLEFTAWQSAQCNCWARPVSTDFVSLTVR